ncbi:TPA: hypothetical protein DCR49_03240 [Candidatus Delongbacteria bacterium]|nr:MAG: hypothetical protein A2Y39_05980 [Candidatus Delongbacteria bacterium GWF2_40_14]HAQ61003.1 hypothetical protein [Candidatus Delongbacteria bacterium]
MKISFIKFFLASVFIFVLSCASVKHEPDANTRTLVATVVAQNGVLVGEFDDGSKIIDQNINDEIITWEGFNLTLRTEDSKVYQYISKELFYEGDRVLIRVQDGKVVSVKFSP